MQKLPLNRAKKNIYVKAKTTKFFGFATGTTEITNFFEKIANGIHCFIASMHYYFFRLSVKAMEANSGSDEAMKR
jgi:hypothetical protein